MGLRSCTLLAMPSEPHAAPTVSIVIPAFNEERTIRACLRAAVTQTVPAHEIIVVDNRSTDATVAIVRELQAQHPDSRIVLAQQRELQGITPTRNRGFDLATGELIGRIDADSLVEPDWVEQVQRAFADPTVAACTGPMIYYDMPLRRFGHRADDALRRGVAKLTREYHLLFGSNMAIRASAWRVLRAETCLDADDLMHEDIDLTIHLHQHSMRVVYSSSMVAGMSARRIDDSPRKYYHYVMRFERTYQQHGIKSLALRTPMFIFLSTYPALKAVRKNELRKAGRAS